MKRIRKEGKDTGKKNRGRELMGRLDKRKAREGKAYMKNNKRKHFSLFFNHERISSRECGGKGKELGIDEE